MTIPASAENPQTATDAHERAVDMLSGDRAMVSRMLREHQVLREVVEHSPAAYCVYDDDDRLIVWSDAFEKMHTDVFAEHGSRIASGDMRYPEMIRRHIEANYPPKEVEAQVEAHLEAHRNADGKSNERDYGEHGIFRVSKYPTPSGAVVGNATCIDDIKAREADLIAARVKAEAAERAKAEFLANMSHEIRTPMNGILGMVELLGTSKLDRKQQLYADVIARSGAALMTIIDDILDLSKIEAGQIMPEPESFDFTETMEDCALLFAANASDSQIDLIVRIDPMLPKRMIGDAGRLRQIVSNLLSNAVKFTDTGHVFLDIGGTLNRRDDGREIAKISIVVQDTGCGMSEEMLGTAFEKFTQGDTSSTRAYQGTGMGLSIVAGLVDVLRGTVSTQSVEGQGTTVTVTLDLPVDAGRIVTRTKQGLEGKRVLLIDVPTARCTILNEQLTAWGFETVACADAREGNAMLAKLAELGSAADLVILGNAGRARWDDESFLDTQRTTPEQCPPIIVLDSIDQIVAAAAAADPMVFATLPCPGRSSALLATIEKALSEERALPKTVFGDDIAPEEEDGLSNPPLVALEEAFEPEACDVIAMDDGMDDTGPVAPQTHDPSEEVSAIPARDDGSVDILIVEDNEINQFLLEQILGKSDYSYRIASNGKEAIEAWRTYRPRLILMDLSMPDMSGDEATAAIRKAEEGTGQRVPVVAVTAHALRGDRDRCVEAGMDDYLSKPVKSADVLAMIERWMIEEEVRLAV